LDTSFSRDEINEWGILNLLEPLYLSNNYLIKLKNHKKGEKDV